MGNKLTIFQITVCETVVTNARGGIYFINRKTKGYLPEGVGLLNMSSSTLKEELWFATIFGWDTLKSKHSAIGNTPPAHDVPGTSPEGPLKVLTSGS